MTKRLQSQTQASEMRFSRRIKEVTIFNEVRSSEQAWQYGTVHLEFAYYVPYTLNRTAPVPLQKRRTVPAYLTF